MKQYHDLLTDVMENGVLKEDRTGVGTKSVFGRQIRFDLSQGFPMVTTKKLHWKSILIELLWLMRGDTNIKFLHNFGVTIWDEWANESGDLGPVYGKQWRSWDNRKNYPDPGDGNPYVSSATYGIDQLQMVVDRIKTKPDCRRLIVSAWNVADIPEMKLPPCHTLFQFYVANGKLSCQLYQRSADLFLGVPYNIASYAALTHLIANECGLGVGEFVHTFGDVHIYKNHFAQVCEQLAREPKPLPSLSVEIERGKLFDFLNRCDELAWKSTGVEDAMGISEYIVLKDYEAHPAIKAEVAV